MGESSCRLFAGGEMIDPVASRELTTSGKGICQEGDKADNMGRTGTNSKTVARTKHFIDAGARFTKQMAASATITMIEVFAARDSIAVRAEVSSEVTIECMLFSPLSVILYQLRYSGQILLRHFLSGDIHQS